MKSSNDYVVVIHFLIFILYLLQIFVCFKATDSEIKHRNEIRTLVQQYLNVVKLNIILPDIKPGNTDFYVRFIRVNLTLVNKLST